MRQFVAVLGIVVVLAGVAASSAGADPDRLKLRIGGQAQLVSPTTGTVFLDVSYDCPAVNGTALILAAVNQGERLGTTEIFFDIPCTGKWETLAIGLGPPLPGFELQLGPADARVFMRDEFGRAEPVVAERKVRIVDES
jgi:hypothetical protein